MTEGKRMMIEESRTPLQEFIHKRVQACEWPFNVNIVSPDEIAEKVLPKFNLRATPKAVGQAFASLGYAALGYRRYGEKQENGERKQINLWAVRDADTYRSMSTDEIRNEWIKQIAIAHNMINNADDVLEEEVWRTAHEKGIPPEPALSVVEQTAATGVNVVSETEPMNAGNIPPRSPARKRRVN